jgi:hypothetical protein
MGTETPGQDRDQAFFRKVPFLDQAGLRPFQEFMGCQTVLDVVRANAVR